MSNRQLPVQFEERSLCCKLRLATGTTAWSIFQQATCVPDEADLGQLWNALDEALPVLDISNQLQVTAEAIAQIAQLFQERSQLAFEELEATTSEEGPIIAGRCLHLFVRQSM
ncbi:MAG: hypothetical protein HC899_35100, partial [Leptolyngbyaceae cyanobacterium SM1_4_3]|nr:hypothetical protein [Leptolyngbyaceae cyanobacterium SM1_4_3]